MKGEDGNEGLMDFNFGDNKPLGKKPKLGNRRKKPKLKSRANKGKKKPRDGPPKPWLAKRKKNTSEIKTKKLLKKKSTIEDDLNTGSNIKSKMESSDMRLKKKSMMGENPMNLVVQEKEEDKNHLIEVKDEENLDKLLISLKEDHRLTGFQEVDKWADKIVTKAYFMKNLHLYIKEQEEEILIHLLSIMKSIFYSPEAPQLSENLNFKIFLKNYCECLMNTSESRMAKDLSFEIIPLIFLAVKKDKFLSEVVFIFQKQSETCQANLILFLVEILKSGHLKELDFLHKIYPIINLLVKDSNKDILNNTILLLKEMYLWMGVTMFQYLKLGESNEITKLKNYAKTIKKENMKIKNRHGHRVLRIESYELESPKDLPKEII